MQGQRRGDGARVPVLAAAGPGAGPGGNPGPEDGGRSAPRISRHARAARWRPLYHHTTRFRGAAPPRHAAVGPRMRLIK